MEISKYIGTYNSYNNPEIKPEYEEAINHKSDKETPPVDTKGLLDSDSPACYDRSILHPEHRAELLERMLSTIQNSVLNCCESGDASHSESPDSGKMYVFTRSVQQVHRPVVNNLNDFSMSKAESSEKIVEYDESIGREIYAFSIYDGKVHVSGNEGFEHKAMTYEKLINASLNKSWNLLFNGSVVNEAKLIDTVDGILKYYMNLDNTYKKGYKTDSITNHVNDAFQKWCEDHKQKRYNIDRRA